nr:hypothetical protein [Tanacetum cinerariifolium]
MDEGTKNSSFDHIYVEDLAKLVSNVQPSFKDLDSPEDDLVIVVDNGDKDEDDEVHTTTNDKTEDTSVLQSSSPKSSQIHELTNQVLILQSQKHKLELEKNKAKAEAALLIAQPSFPNNKKLKNFDFITKDGRHIHLTKKEINHQMKLEEDAKAEAAKQEGEVRKAKLVNLLGPKVDPLDKLNDLTNKKRKHADDFHDYFKANKRLMSSVQCEDHLPGTVLNELVLGLGLDDHARTFSSLLIAEINKRNLNPLKQIGTIEQLRQ